MALNFDHQRDRVSSASRTITINTTGSLTVPVGSTLERPTAARGMIRYNTTDSRFEAYDGSVWSGLGGVIDADQNTYIIAESSPGANNNELDFYTNGVRRLQVGSSGNLLFGDTLNKFTVAYSTGNTAIAGTLGVTGYTTLAGAGISNLTATGNFIVNSTDVTIKDPVITIGGLATLSSDDNKDRGIEFLWHNGSVPKTGFFGFDDSTGYFTFIPDATNTGEVFTGTAGSAAFNAVYATQLIGGNIQIGVANSNEINTSSGNITIDSAGGTTTINDILAVNGATTVNSLNVKDTAILLNSDEMGNPTSDVYITVERGTSNNVNLRWNETTDVWEQTSNGTTYYRIVSTDDDYIANLTAGTGISISHTPGAGSTATISTANIPNSSLTNSAITITDGATSQVIDLGETVTFADGTDINVVVSATNTVTVNHNVSGANTSASATTNTFANSFTVTSQGHVTAIGTGTVNFNVADNYAFKSITDGTNTAIADSNTDTFKIRSAQQITATVTSDDVTHGDSVLIGHSNSGVTANTYGSTTTIPVITVDAQGHITSASTINNQWTITDGTTSQIVNNGDTLTLADGTDINVVVSATDTVTVNNTSTLNTVTGRGATTTNTITVGGATVSNLTNNRIVIAGTAGVLSGSANLTFDGSVLNTSAQVNIVGDLDVDNININGNTISSTDTNGNITLTPNGTGSVVISSNTTVNGSLIFATGVSVNTILDEDTMSSNSASALATQQSIKAYVDSATAANSLATAGGTGTGSVNLSSQTLTIAGTSNEIETSASGQTITIGLPDNVTIGNNLTVTGNLTVNGTTTTVNSTTVTVDDPIFTLGGDTAPGSDDNKDRGIEFRYYNGSAKVGFFGFDDSTGYFTFIPDATNTGEVFSGTKGVLDVTSVTGSAASWTTARTITLGGDLTGNVSIDGSANVTLTATVAANSVALGTDTTGNYVTSITNGTYITGGNGGSEGAALTLAVDATSTNTVSKVVARDASGNFAAGTITAALSGNATTASAWATARTITLNGDLTGSVSVNGSADVTLTATIAANSVALGTDTTGDYVATVGAGTSSTQTGSSGLTITGTGEGSSVTIAHADTSSVSDLSSDNSNGVVIQDVAFTFDTYGHVTAASVVTTDLDNRYYTETEADNNFVNVSGDTLTGYLTLHADPVNALHAVTKQYVDAVSEGLHVHASCRVATTDTLAVLSGGTITYDNGASGVGATLTTTGSYTTIDTVTLANTNRILVKNQANTAHNGIYVRTSSTVLTRADDSDSSAEMQGGDFVFVTEGVEYDNTGWVQETNVTTVGTSAVVFVQFSGAGTFTAGTGLQLIGSEFSIDSTVVTLTGSQTLTNKTLTSPSISGLYISNGSIQFEGATADAFETTLAVTDPTADRTITFPDINGTVITSGDTGTVTNTMLAGSIANSKLSNSSVTVGSTNIALGATSTTLAGLTSVTSTSFVGALTGNASTASTWATARTITLNGDLTGSVSINGSADVTLTATVAANSVALGTDTTGNYVTSITNGSYILGADGGSESAALTLSVDATSANTVSKIVARDVSGNFAAGTITAALSGNATTASAWATARTITLGGDLTGNVSISGSADVTLTATIAANSVALGTDTTGNYVTSITNGSYITGADGGSEGAALTLAVDATSANTVSKVVARDASGNFAAGTITAALSGNATTATTLATSRTLWGQNFDGSANVTGDLTSVGNITGSGEITIAAGGTNQNILLTPSGTGNVGIGTVTPGAQLELAETWNSGATVFTHIKSNVTDTASAASSLLIDLQVGGSSKFSVNKEGILLVPGINPKTTLAIGDSTTGFGNYSGGGIDVATSGVNRIRIRGGEFRLKSDTILGFSSGDPTAAGADLTLHRDAANTLAQRNGTTAQTLRIYNTFTDASNYERGIFAWSSNVLQIGTEAAGTGTRRQINLNYTTTIDGGARTNVAALTLTNLGAGTGGLVIGVLNVGHAQDQTRITAFDVANKALGYGVRGSAVSGQGAHRFSGDTNTGTSVGATGSIVDILAPSTATNIFQCRQSDGTVTLNVGYSGAVTIANTVTQSTEATTLATVTKTQVASFPVASFRSGKLIVQAYNSVTGEVQISELLVAHNGTTASATEYGVVFTGTASFVTYDVDISSGNVRLMATNATANSTQYKISETLMVA